MSPNGTHTVSLKTLTVDRPAGGFIRPYQRELGLLARAVDLAWVILALQLSMRMVGYDWSERYTLLAAVACVLFYLSAEGFNVYNDRRSAPLRFDLRNLFGAWALTIIATLALGYALKVSALYSRLAVSAWFLLTPALLGASRVAMRGGLIYLRTLGYNTRKVAIIGAGEQGLRVASTILGAPWMGLELVGIFDDRAPVPGRIPPDLPCALLGRTEDLLHEVASERIDMVYVTLPINDTERIGRLLTSLSDTTISVYFVPDLFLFSMFHGRWVRLGELPAVSVFETPFYGVGGFIKRIEDVVIATVLLGMMAIPMLLIALAVRLSSPGPVFFRQRRYGLDGREFLMWKFRTMAVCEDGFAIPQATRADPRVTRVGAFLRRTSLDEVPQLFNVLGGTMSMVGPRPHATAHNEYYRRLVKHYMVRHKVRPGISGWAQANGLRGETDTLEKMEARVEYDLWYVRNWSILLDLKIVLVTLLRGWRDGNAY
jgi:putative colanic acid biosynthesis UDP-glucose lipid carrier transferase